MQLTCQTLFRLATGLIAMITLVACASNAPKFVPPAARGAVSVGATAPPNTFRALAYHEVEDDAPDQRFMSVTSSKLREQFAWLKANDYHPISIDQILAAKQGGKQLPKKAILLSFDDGYRSFYTTVFPLLKSYDWPAVLAPVGAWIDTPADQTVAYGDNKRPRDQFLTWKEIAEMSRSGLVEVGSHSYNLHYGVPANPQGNTQPAANTRIYDAQTGMYETQAQFEARITHDVKTITNKLIEVTGKHPRVWVWPYGAVSGEALEIIAKNGYSVALTLDDGLASVDDLMHTPRLLISNDPSITAFANYLTHIAEKPTLRVAQVDLDYVYDADPAQMERNLGELVQRIADMQINTVFLQAFADPDGNGLVKSVYFPNSVIPMRADLFNRAAWQLMTRAHVNVYAWLPVLSFDLDSNIDRVMRWNPDTGTTYSDPDYYRRLSPFDPAARKAIIRLYEDLSRTSNFDGILYHDDAVLTDFEDASPHALAAYKAAGFTPDLQVLRANPDTLWRWTQFKTEALTAFTLEITRHVQRIRGKEIKTARNIFAQPILDPESEQWYAQNFDNFLASYDWTAPMAMPLMEKIPMAQAGAWLDRLVDAVATHPGAMDKTIFEIQATDWGRRHNDTDNKPIDSAVLATWLKRMQLRGAKSFGYYPDDFVQDHPKLKIIRPAISNSWYPIR
ncbi:poly-beta-1,6-N-acetyl-D-glucosamine N-deacetylase PgaB [Pusillimonas sp. ANT_WB101]|uniref:poly-beta-1,6-N-acetyl-D-glucosamine N-deacetylase PgaB n=1 Tax=Pusillimonas sp. ANT_WB101 TaxID=2597356 RepID=UPI0011EF6D63|nr:poly-beta-1,6-N-acetyl-D-glucosamine N-deacetylase PgaB [Pusillimonas sp. ANT_WB101]KAA0911104.1 poly-beta-1,6-N-acetyl-D-glucosamine N-deacetylase PgaB [Pusillimonas sp. ANT_WB101]